MEMKKNRNAVISGMYAEEMPNVWTMTCICDNSRYIELQITYKILTRLVRYRMNEHIEKVLEEY